MFIKEDQLKNCSVVRKSIASKAAVLNYSEEAVERCYIEKFSETSNENIRCRVLLLIKLKAVLSEQLFHTKMTPPQVFSSILPKRFQSC